MANLITLFRLLLLFIIVAIALYASPKWQLLNSLLIIINIILDGLDGITARLRNETSVFGAVFDIATDRIIEITLWVVLAKLNMVSIWIAIIFVTRGILVDSLRNSCASQGRTPFSIMTTRAGEFLVKSRTMRFLSGLTKLLVFSWLFFLIAAVEAWPQTFSAYHYICDLVSNILISSAVILCLARGIPVILESIPRKFKR